jgi:hypothetical protein
MYTKKSSCERQQAAIFLLPAFGVGDNKKQEIVPAL